MNFIQYKTHTWMDIKRLAEIYENLVGPITNYHEDFSKNIIINYFISDKFDELKEHLWEYYVYLGANDGSKYIIETFNKHIDVNIPILFQEYAYYKCNFLRISILHYLISESRIRFILDLGKIIENFHPMQILYYELSSILHKLYIPECKNAIINIMKDYPIEKANLLSLRYFETPRTIIDVILYCELYSDEIPFNTNIIECLLTPEDEDIMPYMSCYSNKSIQREIKRIYNKHNLSKYELSNDTANRILFKFMRRQRFRVIKFVTPYITQLNRPKRELYGYMLSCDSEHINKNIFSAFYPLDELELIETIFAKITNYTNMMVVPGLYKTIFTLINTSDKVKPFDIQLFMKLYRDRFILNPNRDPITYEYFMTNLPLIVENINQKNDIKLRFTKFILTGEDIFIGKRGMFKLQNKYSDWKIAFTGVIYFKSNMYNLCKQLV